MRGVDMERVGLKKEKDQEGLDARGRYGESGVKEGERSRRVRCEG